MGRNNNQDVKRQNTSVENGGRSPVTPPKQPISHGKGTKPTKANTPGTKIKAKATPPRTERAEEQKGHARLTPSRKGGGSTNLGANARQGEHRAAWKASVTGRKGERERSHERPHYYYYYWSKKKIPMGRNNHQDVKRQKKIIREWGQVTCHPTKTADLTRQGYQTHQGEYARHENQGESHAPSHRASRGAERSRQTHTIPKRGWKHEPGRKRAAGGAPGSLEGQCNRQNRGTRQERKQHDHDPSGMG
jgi:hypothetical protein